MESSQFTRWERLLDMQGANAENRVQGLTPERELAGACGGYVFYCSDNNYYAVKGCQNRRGLIADRIVAMLANIAGFPVPKSEIIELSGDVLGGLPSMWRPGPAHGSLWLDDVTDSLDVEHQKSGDNPQRFTDLALMYGMLLPEDRQFLYQLTEPRHVWSHDHDLFLDILLEWNVNRAESHLDASLNLDQFIVSSALIAPDHIGIAQTKLQNLTDEIIARIIGSIPTEWGIVSSERAVICEFLKLCRNRFIALSPTSQGVA